MGKKAKEHRKKVAKRNERIMLQRKKMNKYKAIISKMIEDEKNKGKFDNDNIKLPEKNLTLASAEGGFEI